MCFSYLNESIYLKISKPAITPPDWNQVCGDMIHSDALLSSGRPLDAVPRRHR